MNNISFRKNNDQQTDLTKILKILYENRTTDNIQDFINESITILNSPLIKKNEYGQTFFHWASDKDLKAKKQEITPQLLKIALSMQDNHGYTCFHYKKDPKFVKVVSDILGDETPEVFAKTLTLKSNNGETFLHNKQYPETLKMYVKALEERAPEVFEKIYTTQDNFKKSPADILDEDLKELIQAIIKGEKV